MPIVIIDSNRITDWNSFHDVLAEVFGFPGFYGRNMDAWIDCMTSLDDVDSCMTGIHGSSTDPVVIQLEDVNANPEEIYQAIVECSAFVNWRRIEKSDPAILALSFYR